VIASSSCARVKMRQAGGPASQQLKLGRVKSIGRSRRYTHPRHVDIKSAARMILRPRWHVTRPRGATRADTGDNSFGLNGLVT